jgi:hypothetical protein
VSSSRRRNLVLLLEKMRRRRSLLESGVVWVGDLALGEAAAAAASRGEQKR